MANASYRLRGTNSAGAPLALDVQTDDGTSDANAKSLAQSVSTLLGTKVQLFKADGTYVALYTPGSQGTTVSSPSGVSVVSAI